MTGGQPVFIRGLPRSLLKSPSADSESSEAPIRPALLKTDSTSSSSLGTLERKHRMIGNQNKKKFQPSDSAKVSFLKSCQIATKFKNLIK